MKTELKTQTNKFKPVTIEITCESKKELDFFASLFNHTSVNEAAMLVGGIHNLCEFNSPFCEAGGDQRITHELKLATKV